MVEAETDPVREQPISLTCQGGRSSETWSLSEMEEMDRETFEAILCLVEAGPGLGKRQGADGKKKDTTTAPCVWRRVHVA